MTGRLEVNADMTAKRLMTVPASAVTATALVEGKPERFQCPVAAYFGMVPDQHSSGEKIQLGDMTKRYAYSPDDQGPRGAATTTT
ncbi:transposase [Pseudomonas sp. PLMAX]